MTEPEETAGTGKPPAPSGSVRAAGALAAGLPENPVRLVEPFGAGGGPDLLARALAPHLVQLWNRPVVVENVSGAGSTAGPALVAKSPTDGCTLLLSTSAQAYSAVLASSLPYDPLKDFVPITSLTTQPYVLVASRVVGVTTVSELIAVARRRAGPTALTFASTGAASATRLGIEKFNREARITAIDVPVRPADAIADVLAGTIEGRTAYMLAPLSIAIPAIRSGKLAALGVSTATRSRLLPGVPTIAEAGVPGYSFPIWYGLWARTGTSAAVLDRIAKDVAHALADPVLRDWIAAHGGEVMSMTRPEFASFVLRESEAAARLARGARA